MTEHRPPCSPGPLGGCVLVVDDEDSVRTLLGLTLRYHGLAVRLAASGEEAVEVFRRHRAEIGLVLLDVHLGGLDGTQTLAALRELDPGVRCCLMTGSPERYAPEELSALGVARVLHKPFHSLGDLARTLREVAGSATAHEPAGPIIDRPHAAGPAQV